MYQKELMRLAVMLSATESVVAGRTYQDYVAEKKQKGEKPLGKDEWEARTQGKGDGDGGEGKKPKRTREPDHGFGPGIVGRDHVLGMPKPGDVIDAEETLAEARAERDEDGIESALEAHGDAVANAMDEAVNSYINSLPEAEQDKALDDPDLHAKVKKHWKNKEDGPAGRSKEEREKAKQQKAKGKVFDTELKKRKKELDNAETEFYKEVRKVIKPRPMNFNDIRMWVEKEHNGVVPEELRPHFKKWQEKGKAVVDHLSTAKEVMPSQLSEKEIGYYEEWMDHGYMDLSMAYDPKTHKLIHGTQQRKKIHSK